MLLLIFFSFIAGIVTVLSPCILPILPAILSAGAGKGRLRIFGVILGLIISFCVFTLLLTYLVQHLGISANILRYAAISIIAIFGLVMLFPQLSEWFAEKSSGVGNLGVSLQQKAEGKSGFFSGFILGSALGLVWTPCAGPILASIIALIASNTVSTTVILMLLSYSIGAAIPLFLIALGGRWATQSSKSLARYTETIRKVFGLLMLLTAAALFFDFGTRLQTFSLKYFPNLPVENHALIREELNKIRGAPLFEENASKVEGELPKLGKAPELAGIVGWINTSPLTLKDLRGKVVLIDFWTYSCINCIRTLPYLIDWNKKYSPLGLTIIGVHTPEFEFEKDRKNVEMAVKKFGILYPVALDNNYATWNAYHNIYWPAHYLIDQEGFVRQVHFGEGKYGETENAIRNLLKMPPLEIKEEVARIRPITPETYLGSKRGNSFAMPLNPGESTYPKLSQEVPKDSVALAGKWDVQPEYIKSLEDGSELSLNFKATRVYLVMSSAEGGKVKVLLNGNPLPKEFYTTDMDSEGIIAIKEARKYDIINLHGSYGQKVLTLQFSKGISAYAFTFGDEP